MPCTTRLIAAFGAVPVLVSCTEMHLAPRALEAGDFIESARSVSLGKNLVRVTATIANPTDEPVCLYDGVLDLADIVSSDHPDRALVGLEDDPNEADPRHLVDGGPISHSLQEALHARGPYWPGIEIAPGSRYSFSRDWDYGQYAVLYGDAEDGVGADHFPAESGPYSIAFRELQVFRCGLLDDATRARVASELGAFGKSHSPVSRHNPDGVFWSFEDAVGTERFSLDLIAPPDGWTLTEYEEGL